MHNNQENKPYDKVDSFEELFSQAEQRSDYWEERAKLEFTREVLSAMKNAGVTRTELAARLDVRAGMVTRLLTGKNNFELSTMVRIALALKCRFRSHLHSTELNSQWINVLKDEPNRENGIAWNPKDFKTVEMADCEELNYVPIALNT